jgi:hypothetical protein
MFNAWKRAIKLLKNAKSYEELETTEAVAAINMLSERLIPVNRLLPPFALPDQVLEPFQESLESRLTKTIGLLKTKQYDKIPMPLCSCFANDLEYLVRTMHMYVRMYKYLYC